MPTPSQKESNSSSPSPYLLRENSDGFAFITDNGFAYQLAFQSDQSYFPADAFAEHLYSFSVIAFTPRTPIRDTRIEWTVVDALKRAFEANPLIVISYVCSLDGDMERHRRILFGQWYQRHGAGFVRLPFSNEQTRIYAAAIFQENHPHTTSIAAAFEREYTSK
jgi:hypothetical protein